MDRNLMLIFGGFLLGISACIFWSRLKMWNDQVINFQINFQNTTTTHNWYSLKMEPENSMRVFGFTQDLIEGGKWKQAIVSLWRRNGSFDFFIMVTSETDKQKTEPITKAAAKQFIMDKSDPEEAKRIINDWFDKHKMSE